MEPKQSKSVDHRMESPARWREYVTKSLSNSGDKVTYYQQGVVG